MRPTLGAREPNCTIFWHFWVQEASQLTRRFFVRQTDLIFGFPVVDILDSAPSVKPNRMDLGATEHSKGGGGVVVTQPSIHRAAPASPKSHIYLGVLFKTNTSTQTACPNSKFQGSYALLSLALSGLGGGGVTQASATRTTLVHTFNHI